LKNTEFRITKLFPLVFAPVITANLIVAVLQETKCRRYPRSFSLNVIYSITDLSR